MISQDSNSVNLAQIIVPYRGDPYDVLRLKLVGDLGQVLFLPYHLCDEEAIRRSIKHSNIVINLVGRDWETRNFTFDQVVSVLSCIVVISRNLISETIIYTVRSMSFSLMQQVLCK